MTNYPYKTREGGATVTVFVPYDCGNHCPFCINKQEYENPVGFSLEKICESIRTMDEITPKCDFVFTGGEPFADLDALQTMLDQIPTTHRVFINTTLPTLQGATEDDLVAFTEKNKDKITCINCSRHVVKYVAECSDDIFSRIAVPVRVNCVLYKDYPRENLKPYLDRFKPYGVSVQFRFDYTDTTPENLYEEESDKILHDLKDLFHYTGMDGCRMRCGYHFDYDGMELTYHKTLPYSTIQEADENGQTYRILYDIIIKQTGEIHSDWDGTVMDVDAYRNVVFEPYDLVVREGYINE